VPARAVVPRSSNIRGKTFYFYLNLFMLLFCLVLLRSSLLLFVTSSFFSNSFILFVSFSISLIYFCFPSVVPDVTSIFHNFYCILPVWLIASLCNFLFFSMFIYLFIPLIRLFTSMCLHSVSPIFAFFFWLSTYLQLFLCPSCAIHVSLRWPLP
jgi:hypothetical protein